MIKQFTYSILIVLSVTSCENNIPDHSQHSMQGMEGRDMAATNQDTTTIDGFLLGVVNPVNEIVISNQETIKPTMKGLGNNISADGYISFDERRNNKVSARFGGRIEKLYVKYNYQYVKKGEKIMDLYSPGLNTIEEEYIHHLTTISDKNLIQKTKEKLLLLGFSESEITKIKKANKPLEVISIYSTYEGYVLFNVNGRGNENKQPTQSVMNMGSVRDQTKSEMQVPSSTQIKEGSYVNEGQTLFIVNDFKEVWAIVGFNSKDEPQVKIKTAVNVLSELTDEPIQATINFIEPFYKEGQKYTQARIHLKNEKQQYKINSLVTAWITEGKTAMRIPSSAVLDLGERKIVWVKRSDATFQARNVVAGNEMNGFTEIISGITEKDEIAKDAGYLIDSESLIKSK